MCETNAFLMSGGREDILLESVARIEVDGNTLKLVSIFGDRKSIEGKIVEINFQGGKAIIEKI